MLVGRYSLGSQLAANPVGLFSQDDLFAETAGCQRGRNTAQPSPYNQNVGLSFVH